MGKSKELAELVSPDGSIDVTNTLDLTSASGSRIYSDVANAYTYITSMNPAGSGLATHYHNANEFRIQTGNTDRLAVDASGRVTMPYQPCFHARPTAQANTNWTNGVYVTAYGTVPINDGNHFNGTTGIFTAPVAGRYVFHASLRFDNFNGSYLYYDIRINDSGRQARTLTSLNFTYHTYALSCVANMQANDTARIWVNSNGDTAVSISSDCDFYGYMIG